MEEVSEKSESSSRTHTSRGLRLQEHGQQRAAVRCPTRQRHRLRHRTCAQLNNMAKAKQQGRKSGGGAGGCGSPARQRETGNSVWNAKTEVIGVASELAE